MKAAAKVERPLVATKARSSQVRRLRPRRGPIKGSELPDLTIESMWLDDHEEELLALAGLERWIASQ